MIRKFKTVNASGGRGTECLGMGGGSRPGELTMARGTPPNMFGTRESYSFTSAAHAPIWYAMKARVAPRSAVLWGLEKSHRDMLF